MAKFLQDTIEETALQRKGAKGESVQEFVNFMERVSGIFSLLYLTCYMSVCMPPCVSVCVCVCLEMGHM